MKPITVKKNDPKTYERWKALTGDTLNKIATITRNFTPYINDKMNKFFTFLCAATMSVMTNANDFESNGIYYNIKSSTNLTVEVSHNGEGTYSGDIIIPEYVEYNGKTLSVVAVGEKAFFNCPNLTSVSLGGNIEEIGERAFVYCSGLNEISLSGKIKNIGAYAFSDCTGFSSFVIPSNVETINDYAFSNCTGINNLTIEDGVKTIGKKVFYGCTGLNKVSIPSTVEIIDVHCFQNCNNLIELEIQDGNSELKLGSTHPWFGINVEKLYIGRNIGHVPGYYNNTFWKMTTPKEYTVGSNVDNLNWMACGNVQTITLLCTTPPSCESFSDSQYASVKIIVPVGTKDTYMQVEPWKNFWNITEGTPSGINEVYSIDNSLESIYSVDGRKIPSSKFKGIKILKTKTGKNVKVYCK